MTQDITQSFTSPLTPQEFFATEGAWHNLVLSLLSMHSGESRPSYVRAGTLWLDIASTPWLVKLFDGTNDIALLYVDPAAHTVALPDALTAIPRDASVDTAKLAAKAVTHAKYQDISALRLLGRDNTGTGSPKELEMSAFFLSLFGKTDAVAMGLGHSKINGLKVSNNDPTSDSLLDVAAGSIWSSDLTVNMVVSVTQTRSILSAWGVDDVNADVGGMLNGDVAPAEGFIHVWVISKDNGVDVSIGFTNQDSTGMGLSVGNLPVGYTKLRYLFTWPVQSGVLVEGTQWNDDFLYTSPTLDYNGAPATGSFIPVLVPLLPVNAHLIASASDSSRSYARLYSKLHPTIAVQGASVSASAFNIGGRGETTAVASSGGGDYSIPTLDAEVTCQNQFGSTFNIITRGWTDLRRGEFA